MVTITHTVETEVFKNYIMKIEKIKTKQIIEYGSGGGSILMGQKIIIETYDKQLFSITEVEKIKEFFKTLRA